MNVVYFALPKFRQNVFIALFNQMLSRALLQIFVDARTIPNFAPNSALNSVYLGETRDQAFRLKLAFTISVSLADLIVYCDVRGSKK